MWCRYGNHYTRFNILMMWLHEDHGGSWCHVRDSSYLLLCTPSYNTFLIFRHDRNALRYTWSWIKMQERARNVLWSYLVINGFSRAHLSSKTRHKQWACLSLLLASSFTSPFPCKKKHHFVSRIPVHWSCCCPFILCSYHRYYNEKYAHESKFVFQWIINPFELIRLTSPIERW